MHSRYVENYHCTYSRLLVYHRRWGESGLKAMYLIIHFLSIFFREDKCNCVDALKASAWACFLISKGHKHIYYFSLPTLCTIPQGSEELCSSHCWKTITQILNLELKISLWVSNQKFVIWHILEVGRKGNDNGDYGHEERQTSLLLIFTLLHCKKNNLQYCSLD